MLKLSFGVLICLLCSVLTSIVSAQGYSDSQPTPIEVIKSAKVIFIRSDSAFVKSEALESEMLKQPLVRDWGLIITRDQFKAEMIVEVKRKPLSRKYILSVFDPRTNTVLFAGNVRNSIFSNLHRKLAEKFVEHMREAGR